MVGVTGVIGGLPPPPPPPPLQPATRTRVKTDPRINKICRFMFPPLYYHSFDGRPRMIVAGREQPHSPGHSPEGCCIPPTPGYEKPQQKPAAARLVNCSPGGQNTTDHLAEAIGDLATFCRR